jgi:hypothetical protein
MHACEHLPGIHSTINLPYGSRSRKFVELRGVAYMHVKSQHIFLKMMNRVKTMEASAW